jgi:hypothetical protein
MQQSLPIPRGPLTESLFGRLRTGSGSVAELDDGIDVLRDDDVQLALHVLYELSYRGYAEVDEALETDLTLFAARRHLEKAMEHRLRDQIGPLPSDPRSLLAEMSSDDSGPSLSGQMLRRPDITRVREFAVHRSAYQLKEADPHSWALPRLAGRAKSAMVEIQSDEYGRGVPGAAHAELFADTMVALDLDPTYGRYIDLLPGTTLATGNLISMLGLQRRLLPALIGHLALFEMTSIGPMGRYSRMLRRLGIGETGRAFFDVHVVADAYHEVLALTDLVGGYLEDHPDSGPEICFGALALAQVEGAFSGHLLDCFEDGRTSLRSPMVTGVSLN